jgi:hypothetical protein
MAIIVAVDNWRPYLQHQEFVLRTDHKSLLHLTEQRISTKLQQKTLFKLMDLQFRVVFKQGSTNMAADALSRLLTQCGFCPSVNQIGCKMLSWVTKKILRL